MRTCFILVPEKNQNVNNKHVVVSGFNKLRNNKRDSIKYYSQSEYLVGEAKI